MTKERKAKILVLILQAIGCKVTFTDDDIEFSRRELISDSMYNQIIEHKEEVREVLGSDLRLMSINTPKGAVGYQLKNMINKYYPDVDCSSMQKNFDQLDARGHEWCHTNKHKLIVMMQTFAVDNDLNFTYRQMLTIVKKAISDARKTFIS